MHNTRLCLASLTRHFKAEEEEEEEEKKRGLCRDVIPLVVYIRGPSVGYTPWRVLSFLSAWPWALARPCSSISVSAYYLFLYLSTYTPYLRRCISIGLNHITGLILVHIATYRTQAL